MPPSAASELDTLHGRAADNLRFIRDAMARAGEFTAVPGWGGVAMGATALVTTWLAGPPRDDWAWLEIWLADAALAATIGVGSVLAKSRRTSVPLGGIAARRFALAFVPPLVAGAVLTVVFAFASRVQWGQWYLAAGFGCGHLIGGVIIARSTVARPALDRPPTTPRRKKTQAPAPLALDRVIHERLRLGIISALAVNDRLTFNELKQLLHTTDGNLSVHARKLEDAEYISCQKTFDGRVPRTEFRVTAAGRRALDKYLAHMEAIIDAVKPRQ